MSSSTYSTRRSTIISHIHSMFVLQSQTCFDFRIILIFTHNLWDFLSPLLQFCFCYTSPCWSGVLSRFLVSWVAEARSKYPFLQLFIICFQSAMWLPLNSVSFLFLQPIDKEQLALLTPVAFCHALGHVMSNVSFAAVAVSFTHTIKGTIQGSFDNHFGCKHESQSSLQHFFVMFFDSPGAVLQCICFSVCFGASHSLVPVAIIGPCRDR